jgi:transcriptional regulator with XRE-family HTH domain
MTPEEHHGLAVGSQIRRWRAERGFTLATVADRSGLNVGYLSQIENGKASPSLHCLGAIAQALDVPPAWFLMADVPAPFVVRASERPETTTESGRVEHVDGRASRDLSILEFRGPVGSRVVAHAHAGDEHHLVLQGRIRMTQGDHTVELGPGDYMRWDGTIPHNAEIVASDDGPDAAVLIIRVGRPGV